MSGEREHALLSASAAHRWLKCTPCARIEERLPDTQSESAKEGTLAHAIAELKLRNMAIEPMPKRTFNSKLKKLQAEPLYQKEMERHTDEYIEYIKEIMLRYPDKPFVQAETKVDYSAYAPEGFGTADCILICNQDMHIIDLKYGKSVAVSAVDNPQLKLYALGALSEFSIFFDIQNVYTHIFQPRAYEEVDRDWQTTTQELRAWGESIKETALKAFNGEGEQIVGEHCKFCRAKAICRAQANHNLELAKHDFKLPPTLSHGEVGAILAQARDLSSWVKKLEEWALSELLTGAQVPGWKAVEGRSSRSWADQEKAFSTLIENGIKEEILYERKPLTLAQIETEIGKKDFRAFVGNLVEKMPGKPTLAEETDKREAITNRASAQEDFKNE